MTDERQPMRDDPAESGELEDPGEGGTAGPIPLQQDPAESGALDDDAA